MLVLATGFLTKKSPTFNHRRQAVDDVDARRSGLEKYGFPE